MAMVGRIMAPKGVYVPNSGFLSLEFRGKVEWEILVYVWYLRLCERTRSPRE